MQSENNTKRDGRATRIPAEPEAEQIIALLDSEAATTGQRNFINNFLRELADETGARLPKSGADLRDFYLGAAYGIGAANPRWRLREALKMIAEGERFDDYKKGDPLYVWKDKRKLRNHSGTKETAAELERRLSDPKTPDDYRAALKRSLRAFCKTARSKYDEKARGWTYTEARAEGDCLSTGGDEWRTHWDERINILHLLEGLRKGRALASVEIRGGGKGQAQPKKEKHQDARGSRKRTTICEDIGQVGFSRGDIVEMELTDDLKPWDILGIVEKGDENLYFGRVVVCAPQSITYQLDEGQEFTTPRAEIIKLYRVDPEPVGRDDGLTDEQRATLKKLRGRLDALGSEDDQIIRCTARYELEKKIFDIEHPAGGDPNDWSAWEKKADEA